MKKIVFTLLLIIPTGFLIGQDLSYASSMEAGIYSDSRETESDFVFYAGSELQKIEERLNDLDATYMRKHKLGQDIARLLHILEEEFTYVAEPEPGSFSGRLIVEKPLIYNSIYKLEKYFRTGVRKGRISEDIAKESFADYVRYSLVMLNRDSGSFETALAGAETPEDILLLYNRIQIIMD